MLNSHYIQIDQLGMTTMIVVLHHKLAMEKNQIEVGMDDYLQDTTTTEEMLSYAFQNDELGDDSHITDTVIAPNLTLDVCDAALMA